MTQFLGWLWAQASYVYQWFGSNFWAYLTIVSNTWDWIVTESERAFDRAVSWAWDRIREIQQDMTGLFDWVVYQFARLRDDVAQDISGLFDWVQYQIDNLSNLDLGYFQGLLDELWNYVWSIPDSIQSWVYDRINEFQSWAWDNFGWVRESYDYILSLINSIPFDLFARINNFFEVDYPNILEFLKNPTGFILDLLWPRFISFACFVIAHALGTTKYDIPYQPPWKD